MDVTGVNSSYTNRYSDTKQTSSTKIDLHNISQNEVNELIRDGILDLSANTLVIIPLEIVQDYGEEYAMNMKVDLIKQTEKVIAYNKSIGQSTDSDEKVLQYFYSVQGEEISALSELFINEKINETNIYEQSNITQKSETDIEKLLNDLREKGALKFLAELDKEKIEQQVEKYRKELEEKYKDDPKMMAQIDGLVEKFKKQLIEEMEEKIKQDASKANTKSEAMIKVVQDSKPTDKKKSFLEQALE
ncbi:hypothetical protein [Sulfurimonas sp.]|uniref:hypothetical protein n=1 Tax=Sulfurimonas sp. TaxID=2022749 RepID=UPI003D0EAC31